MAAELGPESPPMDDERAHWEHVYDFARRVADFFRARKDLVFRMLDESEFNPRGTDDEDD